ncbi:inx [Lepeophtheirus salmonis]|uniref:Innexin n=1 Tax=Lepeophtheirus salmonis TaxID=72036 RepID=A0A7R8D5Q4_LEPSM|nr:inx [Lepeophtheirus salmonis]CAF3037889.1 inx [Lepeophtheirus salmonis]
MVTTVILEGIQNSANLVINKQRLSIDNLTFKLFYQWTVAQLICFSILISCNQVFGESIVCDLPRKGVNQNVLQSYCLMYSTFNIPSSFTGPCARTQPRESVYNTYYQWVAIFLMIQSIIFYIPRIIWLMLEGGLMSYLGKGTTGKLIEDMDQKTDALLSVFKDQLENKYNRYTFLFFFCEILNIIILISQCSAFIRKPKMKVMLNNEINPMCEVFPRIASCNYWKYGGAGAQMRYTALCILSLNIIIDKIYVWLWFCRRIRFWMMQMKMHRFFKEGEDLRHIRSYLDSCKVGDWFVLYQMSKNLNKRFFYDFLVKLSKEGKVHSL